MYDIFDCTFKCLSNPSCLSLNLAASKGADGKLWCELLSSVKYDNHKEYKRNETSHHFSIKVGLKFVEVYYITMNAIFRSFNVHENYAFRFSTNVREIESLFHNLQVNC